MSTAYRDLTASGVPTRQAAALTGVSRATMHRRTNRRQAPARPLARQAPANKIPAAERTLLLELMNSPEYVDRPPLQIYADLLDQGRYVGSVSTMYRVLGENQQIKERRRQARHRPRARPELLATGPGQVYTWDITKLAGPVKGTWYDAYVMIEIYSRYIVGAHVHATESGPLAVEMMREIFIHGIPQVVHADRGTSMTSKTVTALLADLNVTKSHSRPKVSNVNPYSEAWFKTMKYAPVFPARFGSLTDARTFVGDFVDWYNHEHRHTGIGLHTPADVHYGHATAKGRPTRHDTGSRQIRTPRTVRHNRSAQDPGTPGNRLNQRTPSRKPSRLTPTGLTQLEKFRIGIAFRDLELKCIKLLGPISVQSGCIRRLCGIGDAHLPEQPTRCPRMESYPPRTRRAVASPVFGGGLRPLFRPSPKRQPLASNLPSYLPLPHQLPPYRPTVPLVWIGPSPR